MHLWLKMSLDQRRSLFIQFTPQINFLKYFNKNIILRKALVECICVWGPSDAEIIKHNDIWEHCKILAFAIEANYFA